MRFEREDLSRRIVDTENIIPEDEPCFLLRGKDKLTPGIILEWASRLLEIGGDPALVRRVQEFALHVKLWQQINGCKVPDGPKEPTPNANVEELFEIIKKWETEGTISNSEFTKVSEIMSNIYGGASLMVLTLNNLKSESLDKDPKLLESEDFNLDILAYKQSKLAIYFRGSRVKIIKNACQLCLS